MDSCGDLHYCRTSPTSGCFRVKLSKPTGELQLCRVLYLILMKVPWWLERQRKTLQGYYTYWNYGRLPKLGKWMYVECIMWVLLLSLVWGWRTACSNFLALLCYPEGPDTLLVRNYVGPYVHIVAVVFELKFLHEFLKNILSGPSVLAPQFYVARWPQ